MEAGIPLAFAAIVGFSHAFEADHLVAVSSLVTKRDKLVLAIKDGIYWGMGHTSTIFLIGLLIIVGKATFLNPYFGYFEAIVGVMLIALGAYRIYSYFSSRQRGESVFTHDHSHHVAYSVGLVHGLAGSGAMVLLVMSEIQGHMSSMLYLLLFGAGSVAGMLVAAAVFSIPFAKRISDNVLIQSMLVVLSSMFCIIYGGMVMVENLG